LFFARQNNKFAPGIPEQKHVKIKGVKFAGKKRFHKGIDEFTITRSANISPSTAKLQFNETFANRLCTVEEVLRRNVFIVVDVKVKVVQKQEGKELVYKNGLIHI